jgi:hypothetical protein
MYDAAERIRQQIERLGTACVAAKAGDYEQMIAIPAYVYSMGVLIGQAQSLGYTPAELGEMTAANYGVNWADMSASYEAIKALAPTVAAKIREHVPNFRISMYDDGGRAVAAPVGNALAEINLLLDQILAHYA